MATRASKGPDEVAGADDEDAGPVAVGRAVRSVVEEPRRSPAEREGGPPAVEDWTWEAE